MNDKMCIGIPQPEEDFSDFASAPETRGAGQVHVHHWKAYNGLPKKLPQRRIIRLRDGSRIPVDYEMTWYFDRAEGTTKAQAVRKIYDVLLNPRSWSHSGVHWKRVMTRAEADIILRVIPQDTTECGPGSAGCYSWGYEADGKPVAEIGSEYINNPGAFAVLVGMEMQGHGTFAMEDHYMGKQHAPYHGVMGTWQSAAASGYYPTESEVAWAKEWLSGQTAAEYIHKEQ